MALDAALPAHPREHALARGLTARVGLTLLVAASFAARCVAAAAHPVPRYFPDEYLYTAIARSLGAGHAPAVRGEAAHFPALLEPLLAAPLQALFSAGTAYRLTQGENALAMSLAAVPVYLLARRLGLTARYGLACAAFALLLPDLVYASYTLADPIGYPLALAAVAAGVAALDRPTRRRQVAFLAFALLATLARVQYVVLPAAFVVAALALDRRSVLRTQRLPLALIVLPALGALVLGPSRILGYYSHAVHRHVGAGILHWAAVDLFLLALTAGVVLVPGALVALARPRGRTERVFAALAAALAAGLLLEAALWASNGSPRYQERYLFALLPLVPVAFGLYLKHGRPGRLAVAGISLALLVVSARVPLSGYAEATGKTDSPFLFAVFRLERHLSTSGGALLVALLAAAAALGAIAVSRRGGGRVAVGAALAIAALASIGAAVNDAANARQLRHDYLPANPSWVDATGLHDVTLVQTVDSPPDRSLEQLYWNRSLAHEVRLGDALPTDVYAAPRVRIAADGTLEGVGPNVLVQGYAASARFQNAQLVAQAGTFSLWSAGDAAPRLALLETGRFSDGWLARSGRLTVWPDASGRVRGTLAFTLSLPAAGRPVRMRFGSASYLIEPGRTTDVTYTLDARGPWTLPFSTSGGSWIGLRAVGVRASAPAFLRAPGAAPRATSAA